MTELDAVLEAVRAGRPVATASVPGAQLVVWPGRVAGTLGQPGLDYAAAQQATGMLALGNTGTVHLGEHGQQRHDEVSVFVQSYVTPPRMIVFGAIDFAGAVARIGRFLGYHVTVCDARPVFATRKRFPDADDLVVQWPHKYLATTAVDERTVLCVLTHDPKFDVPLLEVALRTKARYIGVMGSRRTHDDRMKRLREAGVDESALARLSSPIGLDLGARTPEETAVAIAAEIISQSWGGSGRRLADLKSPIHHPARRPRVRRSPIAAVRPT
jgi:xanthine dehydrogenase accessory factor